jgi:hypothetical protein
MDNIQRNNIMINNRPVSPTFRQSPLDYCSPDLHTTSYVTVYEGTVSVSSSFRSLLYCDRSPEIWAVATQRTTGYRCHIRGNGYRQLSNYTQRLGETLYPRQPLCTVTG